MAGLDDYRTPEQIAEGDEGWRGVRTVLADATEAGASMLTAMRLGEPQDVVELWIDRLWDGVRDRLDHEQLVTAVLELLHPAMQEQADQLTDHLDT